MNELMMVVLTALAAAGIVLVVTGVVIDMMDGGDGETVEVDPDEERAFLLALSGVVTFPKKR